MDFLILGPIEVHSADGAVALGGTKPRAVLAVLLLHANRPVSAERLALALWGEDAPGGAVKTVQVHVSRLRKALGDPDVIATSPAGYCLRVRDGELDAARFERLVEEARRGLAAGQPADASAILREAIGLWRGHALADLADEPFARAESARLQEQRLAAIELRVEADLAAGRHAEVVGELAQLVADHPTREQLSGQLMLALYRCGRQSDALEAYASVRRVLVEDMGIEPGPELRDLHAAILRQDVALRADTTAGELPPALDPSASQPLVGREDELAWLLARCDSAKTNAGGVVALIGPRGAGKTRLAQELAREAHGDGVAVVHASGAGPADAILVALGRVRAATRPVLLVIDDVDRAGAGVRSELAGLELRSAPALVVACAQDGLALTQVGAADTLELAALDAEAVREIAARYAPGRPVEEVPAEWLLDASGGVARRVHEVAGQWARREAARHVGAVADRAVAGRAELRSIEAELTGGVVDLQETRERSRPRGDDAAPVVCPFKGLASYDVADARYFFGRERLVAELVARLVGAPLLGIVGPSGSGKSSVMRAGLLPALAGGVLPGSEDWAQAPLRPGAHPMRELGLALAGVPAGGRVVLAVDQFEETFTVCDDEAERAEFIDELVHAASAEGRYLVVLALRADHYGRCAAYPELARLLATSNVLVHPMLHDELLRAIERPAQVAGLRIEPELSDALVADVEREPGGLPLLSTALLELWQRRDARRLRHAVYVQMGGVHGAVARLAESAYGELDEGQRSIARRVLMRMVDAGDGDGVERRRVALAELETERDADLARVVALLTDRRLLTVSAGTVELAHEALLREWPRLHGWIDEDRDGLRIRRALGAAARDWDGLGRDDGALYRGARLRTAVEWRAASNPTLSELERAFLAGGEAASARERATRRRRGALVFGAAAVVVIAVVVVALVAVLSARQRDIAASRDIATRAETIIPADPGLALAAARVALDRHDTEQAAGAVRQATLADRALAVLRVDKGTVYHLASSPDGRRLATASADGTVRIWSVATRRVVATVKGAGKEALDAEFSRDGAHVAVSYFGGEIAVADADGGGRRTVTRLRGGDFAPSLRFTPDGHQIVVGTYNGAVALIAADPAGSNTDLGRHGSLVSAVDIDRDGGRVVSVSVDGTADVWGVATHDRVELAHDHAVLGASFSADGRRVATSDEKGDVRIWDPEDGRLLRRLHVDAIGAGSVRFSADGRRIVTADANGAVRVTDAANGALLSDLRGHGGAARDALFVPGDGTIASVGEDGTLRVWAADAVVARIEHGGTAPSFSRDGRYVVTGDTDGSVLLWDLRTRASREIADYAKPSVASFSADGATIVSVSEDGSVGLYDVARGRGRAVPAGSFTKYAAAVAPGADLIAVAGDGSKIVLERPDGGGRRELRGHTADVYALAFSPDGRYLVSGSADDTARIWDVATGTTARVLRGHDRDVEWVAFSDDSSRVATAADDGTVRVWSVHGGDAVVLFGHDGRVNTATFDPTGKRVVSAGDDATVRIWDVRGGEALVVLKTYKGPAFGADFGPRNRVVSSGDDALTVSACEVCGSMSEVLKLAATRARHEITAGDRERLLLGGD